jgi:hypothetical protein
MLRRRAAAASITTPIGCHSLRSTGITAYPANGGTLEHVQAMAAHARPRTHQALQPDPGVAHPERGRAGALLLKAIHMTFSG